MTFRSKQSLKWNFDRIAFFFFSFFFFLQSSFAELRPLDFSIGIRTICQSNVLYLELNWKMNSLRFHSSVTHKKEILKKINKLAQINVHSRTPRPDTKGELHPIGHNIAINFAANLQSVNLKFKLNGSISNVMKCNVFFFLFVILVTCRCNSNLPNDCYWRVCVMSQHKPYCILIQQRWSFRLLHKEIKVLKWQTL